MPTPTIADSLTAATAKLGDVSDTVLAQGVALALRYAALVKATGMSPDPNVPMELAMALALGPRFEAVGGGSVNALAVRLSGGDTWPFLLYGMSFALPTLGANTGPVTVRVSGFTLPPAPVANSGQPAGTLQLLGKGGGQLAPGDLDGSDVHVRFDGAGGLRLTGPAKSESSGVTSTTYNTIRQGAPYLGFHGEPQAISYPSGTTRVPGYASVQNNLPSATYGAGIITIGKAGRYRVSSNLNTLMPDTGGAYSYAPTVSRVNASGVPLVSVAATEGYVTASSLSATHAANPSGIVALNAGDLIAAFMQHNLGYATTQLISLDVEWAGTLS